MHMLSMPAMFATPGRTILAGVLALFALMAVPSAATPAGKIVIYGAHPGSTLTLLTKGKRIVIKGRMAHRKPRACRFTRGHRVAVCTRRASSIEIRMGPSGDLVRVK